MKNFLALVEKDEGSAFGVTFPDLPGCFSAADTEDRILPNAMEALDLWFQDMPDAEPRPLARIRQDCAAQLAAGAFLMTVPHVRRSTRQRRVNVSLDAGTLQAVDMAAGQLGLTRSGFLAMAALNQIRGGH